MCFMLCDYRLHSIHTYSLYACEYVKGIGRWEGAGLGLGGGAGASGQGWVSRAGLGEGGRAGGRLLH